jgi:[ribosomal protein S5]-alanine N-acetyltransferase
MERCQQVEFDDFLAETRRCRGRRNLRRAAWSLPPRTSAWHVEIGLRGYGRAWVELAMPELQRLNAGHASAVLAFELANRAYFAGFISDRGDDFFDQFTERLGALLAEQEAGASAFHVLVGDDGSVLGRFNLVKIEDGTAELGYRVAQHAAGRGLATATVRELCRLAATQYGLRTLRAATSRQNAASQKVLTKTGFVPAGPADPADIGGKEGTWYQRDLAAG